MKRFLPLILLLLPMAAEALVIRADVDDAHYQIMGSAFPALVDLPDEGHGVLIAPQWVLTTAQAATAQPIQRVVIDGVSREVRSVQIHPGYRPLPDASAEATAVAHARAVRATLAGRDDLALIRLASPVGGVKPVALYRGSDELGHSVRLIGKGASGDGEHGALADSLPRAQLRVASNVIDKVDPRWLFYRFDPPATASSHEGMIGRGDQGGPLLLEANGRWELAGLASWPLRHADPQRAGRYGDGGYNLRVSRYLRWIEAVIAAYEPEAGAHARARAG